MLQLKKGCLQVQLRQRQRDKDKDRDRHKDKDRCLSGKGCSRVWRWSIAGGISRVGDWCGPWSCCGGRPTASRPEIQCQEVEDLLSLVLCVPRQGEGGWGGEGGVQDGDGGGRGDLDCGRPQRARCHAARCSMVPGAVIRSPLNHSLSSANSWRIINRGAPSSMFKESDLLFLFGAVGMLISPLLAGFLR